MEPREGAEGPLIPSPCARLWRLTAPAMEREAPASRRGRRPLMPSPIERGWRLAAPAGQEARAPMTPQECEVGASRGGRRPPIPSPCARLWRRTAPAGQEARAPTSLEILCEQLAPLPRHVGEGPGVRGFAPYSVSIITLRPFWPATISNPSLTCSSGRIWLMSGITRTVPSAMDCNALRKCWGV